MAFPVKDGKYFIVENRFFHDPFDSSISTFRSTDSDKDSPEPFIGYKVPTTENFFRMYDLINEEIEEWIKDNCFTVKGTLNNRVSFTTWWVNKGFEDKLFEIKSKTSYLTTDNITQRIYHICNDVIQIPTCKNCTNKVSFRQFKTGYREYCSLECTYTSRERNKKISDNNNYANMHEKQKEANLKKYGVEYYYQTEEFKSKSKNTKTKKYSDPYYNNIEKNKNTCMERYGVESLFDDNSFQIKLRESRLEKYKDGVITFFGSKSKAELDILNFLNSTGHIFKSDRHTLGDGTEIDAYCEDLKLGVEYCGLYWHSERWKDNNYHYKKYLLAKTKGIHLITIFEDEWKYREEQVKQYLLAQLGIFKERIYARNCIVEECEKDYDFFNRNHIQGAPSSILRCFQIRNTKNILGKVSFSRHHRINNIMVLNRLAFENSIQVVGGASKLIKFALKSINQNIITWSDNRWSTGEIYLKCGFKKDSDLSPDYSYVLNDNTSKRKSKQVSKKKNLNIPDDVTEHQWHLDRGIYRIYDCGKQRFIYHKEII